MIKAFTPDRANDAFHVGFLPWRARCGADGVDVQMGNRGGHSRERPVAIVY
jgi:hypothetical protein